MIKIYNTTEVAKQTKTSDRTVRRRIQNGEIEALRVQAVAGGRVTYGVTEKALNILRLKALTK